MVKGKISQHQVIFMKDVEPGDMEYLLQFIYLGEVEMLNKDVDGIIKISRELGIVGLSEIKGKEDQEENEERNNPRVAKRKHLTGQKVLTPTKMAKVIRDPELYEDVEDEEDRENQEDKDVEGMEDMEDEEDMEDMEDGEDVEDDDDAVEDEDDEDEDQEDEEEEEGEEEVQDEEVEEDREDHYLLPGQEEVTEVSKLEDLDRQKKEKIENSSLIGSVAKKVEGRNRGRYNYIIGDYVYGGNGLSPVNDGSKILMLCCSSPFKQCRGRAHIDPDTLKVIKFPWTHSCTRDRGLKFQIQMECEMKNLAEMTTDSLRDIYDKVCQKNPSMATRIEFSKCQRMMQRRRNYILRSDKM